MNPDQVKAWVEQHKKPLAAAGAAVVGGLALVSRRRKADAADADAGASPAGAPPALGSPLSAGGTSTGYYPSAYSAYDSSESDVYNAISPQLEALGKNQAELKALWEKQTSPIPVTKPMNNQEWQNQVTEAWVGSGNSARDITAATNAYLKGAPINPASWSGVNWAIGKFGAPPQGTDGVSAIA